MSKICLCTHKCLHMAIYIFLVFCDINSLLCDDLLIFFNCEHSYVLLQTSSDGCDGLRVFSCSQYIWDAIISVLCVVDLCLLAVFDICTKFSYFPYFVSVFVCVFKCVYVCCWTMSAVVPR